MPAKEMRDASVTRVLNILLPVFVWGFSFFFLGFIVDLRLAYFGNGIMMNVYEFEKTAAFFLSTVARPAGLIQYLHAAITHAFYLPWLGALILTGIGWLLARGTDTLLGLSRENPLRTVRYVPAIAMLSIYARLDHNQLDCLLAVLVALGLSLVWQGFTRAKPVVRMFAAAVLVWLAYVALAWVVLLFVLLAGLIEIRNHRSRSAGVVSVLLVSVGVLYLWGGPLFNLVRAIDPATIHDRLFLSERPVSWFYGFFPVLLLSVTIAPLFAKRESATPQKRKARKQTGKQKHAPQTDGQDARPRNALAWIRGTMAVLICLGLVSVAFGMYNRTAAAFMRYITSTLNGNESWVLTHDNTLFFTTMPVPAFNALNRALYRKDRLLTDLFTYPQFPGNEPLLLRNNLGRTSLGLMVMGMDLYMHLGAVNLAEKLGHEAVENVGAMPFLLERMALIQTAKDLPANARIYLKRLRTQPFYTARADSLLVKLDEDSTLQYHDMVRAMREYRDRRDYPMLVASATPEAMLANLLHSNPRNRMAFEYLMASHLLNRQPESIVPELGRLQTLGYTKIPRHLEEALLIHMLNTEQQTNSWTTLPISVETHRKFEEFAQTYARYQNREAGMREALEERFGQTFFFFYAFGYARGGAR